MPLNRIRFALLLLLLVAGMTVAACGDDDEESGSGSTETTAQADSCSKEQLSLVSPGQLTVGTDKPAFPPYFVDDDPTNGKGFESAVAYAVADELGFAQGDVKWTVVPFN
jgi:polar amino acid transport system substrate-binding protein